MRARCFRGSMKPVAAVETMMASSAPTEMRPPSFMQLVRATAGGIRRGEKLDSVDADSFSTCRCHVLELLTRYVVFRTPERPASESCDSVDF